MLVMLFACSISCAAHAADDALIGAWRTTNGCFLSAFLLAENGAAHAIYLSGERDDFAAWEWDGGALTITSMDFPLDSFSGRVMGETIDADYVWHDFDADELNSQSCIFERFNPPES